MTSSNLKGVLNLHLIDLLRGTNIYSVLAELRRHQYMSKMQLDKIRYAKVDRLFRIAKTTTKFYNKYSSYEDLPILTKETVIDNNFDFISNSYKKKLYAKRTGGSTGEPMVYYATVNSQSYLWAGILLSREAAGYKLGDKVAFVGGSSLIKSSYRHKVFYYLLNIDTYYASPLNDQCIEAYVEGLKKSKTKLIYGYAYAINSIADYINKHEQKLFPDLKAIVCTSEMLTDAIRQNIETAFGVKVYNQYGCNESGISAFECEHSKLHLISSRAIYETDANGTLIGTDLSNDGFILMKFNTDDIVKFSFDKCSCQRSYPVINELLGRVNDFVIDMSNNIVYDSFFYFIFIKDKNIRQFQILFNDETIIINLSVNCLDHCQDYNKYIDTIKKHLLFKEYKLLLNVPFQKTENAKHRHVIKISK